MQATMVDKRPWDTASNLRYHQSNATFARIMKMILTCFPTRFISQEKVINVKIIKSILDTWVQHYTWGNVN